MLITEMAQTTKLKLRHIKLAQHTSLSYPSNTPHSKSRLSTHFLTNVLQLLYYRNGFPHRRHLEGLTDLWTTVFQYQS